MHLFRLQPRYQIKLVLNVKYFRVTFHGFFSCADSTLILQACAKESSSTLAGMHVCTSRNYPI